jgi:phosphatidate cytidylyltransferase
MLKTRIITAVILSTLFVTAAFLLSPPLWSLLMLGVVCLGAWEWASLSKFEKMLKVAYVASVATAGLLGIVAYPQYMQMAMFFAILLAAAFWILAAPLLLFTKAKISNRLVLAIIGLLIIVPFGFAMIALREIGPWLLLVLILGISIADSAAYFAGTKFGKHKLAPSISPGKTWEGVVGALVALYGLLLTQITHQNLLVILVLWVLTLFAVVGDLIESLFKRNAGVKDSGDLLPGHGGVLDRIDALTAALPIMTFMISLPMYLLVLGHA